MTVVDRIVARIKKFPNSHVFAINADEWDEFMTYIRTLGAVPGHPLEVRFMGVSVKTYSVMIETQAGRGHRSGGFTSATYHDVHWHG